MTESSDSYADYISEIQRFVEAEKNFSSTSESELSEDPIFVGPRNRRNILSSDEDDDYFVAKERLHRTHRILTESSDDVPGEDNSISHNLKESDKTVTSNCVEPEKKKKHKRRRRSSKREESRRVDENIQRAKESYLERTAKARGGWRKNRTFGIPIEYRRVSTSRDKLPSKKDKVEVDDVIRQAVGEPPHQIDSNNYDPESRSSCYSPPPSSCWPLAADSQSSICLAGSTPTGFRDLSVIKKSPWFKGKPPSITKLEKNIAIKCTRIEHFVRLPAFADPFVQIDGEKFTIKPEQWLNMNAPN